jgi:hypothetical protein
VEVIASDTRGFSLEHTGTSGKWNENCLFIPINLQFETPIKQDISTMWLIRPGKEIS